MPLEQKLPSLQLIPILFACQVSYSIKIQVVELLEKRSAKLNKFVIKITVELVASVNEMKQPVHSM